MKESKPANSSAEPEIDAPQRTAKRKQSAILAVLLIFGSAGIFLFAILSHANDKSGLLKAGAPCESSALLSFKDKQKVAVFTLNDVESNYSKEHPDSPYLFKLYYLRFGKGGRGTTYRAILEPSVVEIEDKSGLKLVFDAVEYRFMKELAFVNGGEPFPEPPPESVKNAGTPDVWIYAVEKHKPVTFVGTIWSQPTGMLLLKGRDWDKALVSNLSVQQMQEFNKEASAETVGLLETTFVPAACLIALIIIAFVLFTDNRRRPSAKD